MPFVVGLLFIVGLFAAASVFGLLVNEVSGQRAPIRDTVLRAVALAVLVALAICLHMWGGADLTSIAIGSAGVATVIILGLVVAKPHRLA